MFLFGNRSVHAFSTQHVGGQSMQGLLSASLSRRHALPEHVLSTWRLHMGLTPKNQMRIPGGPWQCDGWHRAPVGPTHGVQTRQQLLV